MRRVLLSPAWVALHAVVAAAVAAMVLLGWWQLTSYRQSGGDSARAATASTQPPRALPDVLPPGTTMTAAAAFRPVTVSGRYSARDQLLVPGRRHGGRAGFAVVTPLVLPDGSVAAVSRGWVEAPDAPAAQVPAGPVTVTGTLEPSEDATSSAVDPRTGPAPGQLPYIATAELMTHLPYPPDVLYDGYVLLRAQQPPAEPAPVPLPAEQRHSPAGVGPWRNLSYAAQWWVFAAAAAFFWGAAVRREARRDPAPDDVLVERAR